MEQGSISEKKIPKTVNTKKVDDPKNRKDKPIESLFPGAATEVYN